MRTKYVCMFARNPRMNIDLNPPDVSNAEEMCCDRIRQRARGVYGQADIRIEAYTDQFDLYVNGRKVACYMAGG
jgi:hypothetical protein